MTEPEGRPGSAFAVVETSDGVISAEQMAHFSALLWGLGCLIGILAVTLPHGPTVQVDGWAAVATFAGVVSLWSLWKGAELPEWGNYILSVLALAAVDLALFFAHRSPAALAVGGLFVLPTIFTASFYPRRAFVCYLAAQAASSAGLLFTSGVPGAPAGWALVVGTTSIVGVVVHLLQEALQKAAVTDPLTGLANRRALEPMMARELARCARLGHPLSLAVMDLDHFKEVNDAFGHQYGDQVLVQVARGWSDELRSGDVLARAGGDEFVLLLPSTSVGQALAVLERLEQSTSQGFSAGLAMARPGSSVEDVLRDADGACYEAKQRGRGEIVVAETEAA